MDRQDYIRGFDAGWMAYVELQNRDARGEAFMDELYGEGYLDGWTKAREAQAKMVAYGRACMNGVLAFYLGSSITLIGCAFKAMAVDSVLASLATVEIVKFAAQFNREIEVK